VFGKEQVDKLKHDLLNSNLEQELYLLLKGLRDKIKSLANKRQRLALFK